MTISEEQLQRIVTRTALVRQRFDALREAHETVPNSFDALEAALDAQRLAIASVVRAARAVGELAMSPEDRQAHLEAQRDAAQEEIDRRELVRESLERMPRLRLRALDQ